MYRRAAVNALCFQGVAGSLNVIGMGNKMYQTRRNRYRSLQRRIVHVKPTLGRRIGGSFGAGVDGNNFKVGQRIGRCGDFEQAVVRALLGVLNAGAGCDAQGGFAPLHALFQCFCNDD